MFVSAHGHQEHEVGPSGQAVFGMECALVEKGKKISVFV
jgi:hypothetical protein